MLKRWRALWTFVVTFIVAVLCSVSYKSPGQSQQNQLEPMELGDLYWPSPDTIFFFGEPDSQIGDDACGYYRLQISTGAVQKVMDINNISKYFFGFLSPDGSLVGYGYEDETVGGLYVMNPDGTNPRYVSPLCGGIFAWLPDSRTVAFLDIEFCEEVADYREFMYFLDIESGQVFDKIRIDQRPGCDSELGDPNREREETACAQRCDAGLPCVLSQDIPRPSGSADFFFFPDGQHILFTEYDQQEFTNFFIYDLASLSSQQITFFGEEDPQPLDEFELSPDGTAVAYAPGQLFVLNLQSGTLWELQEPLVPNEPHSTHGSSTWSRDSQWIAFVRTTVFPPEIPEDEPWEEFVKSVYNQIWIVSRDGQQVRLVADLWVDSNGQVVNLASNWPEEKRYYVGKVKVRKLAWKFPPSLKTAWRKPMEKRNVWLALLIGMGLGVSALIGFATWRYRHRHPSK